MIKRLRLNLALWLLHSIPENVWVGRFCGGGKRKSEWVAGRLDRRGVMHDHPLERIFEPGDTACD